MKVKGDYFLTARGPQLQLQHPVAQSRLPHRFVPPASPNHSPIRSIALDSHSFAAPALLHHQHQHHHLPDSLTISDYYSDSEPVASSATAGGFCAATELFDAAHHHAHPAQPLSPLEPAPPAQPIDTVTVRTARYQRAIELIVAKCEALSADNERLVHRLHYVKRITRRKERDVALLKRRLDVFGDGWRTAQPEPLAGAASSTHPTLIPADNNVIVRKKYKKREKPGVLLADCGEPIEQQQTGTEPEPEMQLQLEHQPDEQQDGRFALDMPSIELLQLPVQPVADTLSSIIGSTAAPTAATPLHQHQHQFLLPGHAAMDPPAAPQPFLKPVPAATTVSAKCTKEPRRKRPRIEREKDPNAPKRPANPFFQFCQEQRSILMGELNSELLPGQPELSKQELTRQLANRWRSLDMEGKQIYINMYESSKQKYNEEMQSYRDGGRGGGVLVMAAATAAAGGKVGARGKVSAAALRQRQPAYAAVERMQM